MDRLALDMRPEDVERDVVDAMVDRWNRAPSPLIPGAREAVERLARLVPLAVASSAHREVIEVALERTGLRSFFGVVVSSDEVAHGKPEPDVYLEAARRLGFPRPTSWSSRIRSMASWRGAPREWPWHSCRTRAFRRRPVQPR